MNGYEIYVTPLSIHWSHISSVINSRFTWIHFINLCMYINWNIWVWMTWFLFRFSSSYLSVLLSVLSINVAWYMWILYATGEALCSQHICCLNKGIPTVLAQYLFHMLILHLLSNKCLRVRVRVQYLNKYGFILNWTFKYMLLVICKQNRSFTT